MLIIDLLNAGEESSGRVIERLERMKMEKN